MSREVRLITWLAILIGFGFLIDLLSPILLPFVVGLGIAYLLDPMVEKLDAMGFPRVLASSLILGAFFIVLIGSIAALVPLLEDQFNRLAERLPAVIIAVRDYAQPFFARIEETFSDQQISNFKDAAGEYVGSVLGAVKRLMAGVWRGGQAVFEILSLLVVTPIVAFYLILQWPTLVRTIDGLLPVDHADTIREQLGEIDRTVAGFVRGQLSVCLTLGTFYAVGLTLVGLESGLIVGILAGLISFVPYVGATVGLLTGVGLAWVQFGGDPMMVGMVAGVFVVGQVAESYVLTPRLVGGRVGLHDLWIIFALMAGGALFGLIGVMLAIPVAAIIGVLVRFAVARYKESALYLGTDEDGTPPARP
jgi:predicted PurR-regulated permease PerM